jgi:small subunit ribosomal protein S20
MANHVSAVKRVNQTRKRTAVNRHRKGVLRASLRSFRETLTKGNKEKVEQQSTGTASCIDKAANKGLIHKNTAARLKSRLMRRQNAIASEKP